MNFRYFIGGVVCTFLLSTSIYSVNPGTTAQAHRETAETIAMETFFITYPLYVAEKQMELMTTSAPNDIAPYAPLNTLGHQKALATPCDMWIPGQAIEFLFSSAWMYLDRPYVLHYPAITDRYLCWDLKAADLYPFKTLSPRTRGTGEGNYLVISEKVSNYLESHLKPDWKKHLPRGYEVITSETDLVWLLGRTEVRNSDDIPAVHNYQNQYSLKPIEEVFDANNQIVKTLNEMVRPTRIAYNFNSTILPELKFFNEVAQYLRNTPLKKAEERYWHFLPRIGFTHNGLDISQMDAATIEGMIAGLSKAQQLILSIDQLELGKWINGWTMVKDISIGDDYIHWSTCAAIAKIALSSEEAVYSEAFTDSCGMPLNGLNSYKLHFVTPPPVNNLWTISLYNMQQQLVKNPINRYQLGTNTPSLVYNQDGSLDIYVQHNQPAKYVGNWIPAPEGDFMLELRLHGPQALYYNDEWQEPSIVKTN